MNPLSNRALQRLVDRTAGDADVVAVILFGSQARGDAAPGSDVDVCLVLAPSPFRGVPCHREEARM